MPQTKVLKGLMSPQFNLNASTNKGVLNKH